MPRKHIQNLLSATVIASLVERSITPAALLGDYTVQRRHDKLFDLSRQLRQKTCDSVFRGEGE